MAQTNENIRNTWNKKNMKAKRIFCHIRNDADILEWLEKQENASGYMKNLIREDMKKKCQ